MTSLKHKLKRLAPEPLWRAGRELLLSGRHALQWPAATLHPWRRESMRQLATYRDMHRGERAFIIGNGPSLRATDAAQLEGEYSFGMNRIFLAFPDWGFQTTYLVSVNDLVIEQSAAEISGLRMPKFLTWRARRYVDKTPYTIFLHTTYAGPKFARDLRRRVWEGATVTYVALQLAYYMGFDPVILVGVDHNFTSEGQPNTTVVSQGEDRDHFHADYFGAGFRWQLPDLQTSEMAYAMARQAFAADGRRVLDATVGGRLQVFDKVDYNSLF